MYSLLGLEILKVKIILGTLCSVNNIGILAGKAYSDLALASGLIWVWPWEISTQNREYPNISVIWTESSAPPNFCFIVSKGALKIHYSNAPQLPIALYEYDLEPHKLA